MIDNPSNPTQNRSLYTLAGTGALLAMCANLLDVVHGFSGTEPFVYGSWSAVQWFALFQANWFKGLYNLGILNMVYMLCMLPVYLGLFSARRRQFWTTSHALLIFLLALAWFLLTARRFFQLSSSLSKKHTSSHLSLAPGVPAHGYNPTGG